MEVGKFKRANSQQLARGFPGITVVATSLLLTGCVGAWGALFTTPPLSYQTGIVGANAGAIHPEDPQAIVDRFNDRHQLAGRFQGYGPLRLGDMYVSTTSIHSTNVRQQRTAYLLVNVESDNSSAGTVNRRSYIAEATVDCSKSYFSIARLRNFSNPNAMGSMIGSQDIGPPLLIQNDINNPDATLRAAADIVCKN